MIKKPLGAHYKGSKEGADCGKLIADNLTRR